LGRSGKELGDHFRSHGYEAARPSGWDPVERLKDQDIDGVEAEVLYTTLGMSLFGLADAELQQACFSVYNDWLAEFCAHDRRRLHGVALISLADVGAGTRELQRCARAGLKGGMIYGSAPAQRPYLSRDYDPFWAAAEDLEMPLSLHVFTRGNQGSQPSVEGPRTSEYMNFSRAYVRGIHEVQDSLADIIQSGVLERFARLKIVSAENDTGWLPHFIYRLNHVFEKFGAFSNEAQPLTMKPGDYVRRQIWATFQDDPVGPALYQVFGEDNFMWASDFPHTDSTWPHSRQVIDTSFQHVPEGITRKIVFDNANKLYRMGL
ncbi:MAG TPA: amidohydrolase family protein, partial [Candidatus Binataceae bacterium]|nr:amidohydrolase family protein [Candidatus Binataceae bacterium]